MALVPRGPLHFERIGNPARTVARDPRGTVVATFTDGARTAVLTGPSRTFAEPRTTDAKVVTKSWVRLLPKPWARGAERGGWFRTWLTSPLGSRDPDILATAFEYVAGAPVRTTAAGVKYSGAARYAPDTTSGSGRAAQGKPKPRTGSDFYDYLGIPWTFLDTVTRRPEKDRARSVDSSGYVRLVYGYRSGFPLNSRDNAAGSGLQRTPDAIAHGRLGVPVIPLTDRRPTVIQQLQPGDLVFFTTRELPGKRIGHIGICLGLDPDGDGYYAQGLRGARRRQSAGHHHARRGSLIRVARSQSSERGHESGTRPLITPHSKKARVSDLGLLHGAGDENRTRALSLGS
ncbi:NlpC/P60 family protein [Streptomyces sp. NPDC059690]|uniref:NlpC/P60 family protein n=1 Tax=Streptomyces sp. NPDC059690 TaxID=3346907 RepID=UPI0036CC7356